MQQPPWALLSYPPHHVLLEIFTQIDYLHSSPPLHICFGGAQIKTHLLASKALAGSWKSQLSRFPDAVRLGHPLVLHFWLEFLSGLPGQSSDLYSLSSLVVTLPL